VSEAERGSQELGGDAQEAAALSKEEIERGLGDDFLTGADGGEGSGDGGDEGGLVGEGLEVNGGGDAHGEWRVLLTGERFLQLRQPDEPHREQISAVEGEVEKTGEIEEEFIAEMLSFVDDDDRRCGALVDEVDECFFGSPARLVGVRRSKGGIKAEVSGVGPRAATSSLSAHGTRGNLAVTTPTRKPIVHARHDSTP
jgi:hypothetical protein